MGATKLDPNTHLLSSTLLLCPPYMMQHYLNMNEGVLGECVHFIHPALLADLPKGQTFSLNTSAFMRSIHRLSPHLLPFHLQFEVILYLLER